MRSNFTFSSTRYIDIEEYHPPINYLISGKLEGISEKFNFKLKIKCWPNFKMIKLVFALLNANLELHLSNKIEIVKISPHI